MPCYVFGSHSDAEDAIKALGKSGFDVKALSLVGKGYHSEEQAVGFYTTGDKIKAWGGTGAFWGAIWGLLLAPAVFFLPGLGLVAMAGPIVSSLVGAVEGAVVVGSASALGAALTRIGVPDDEVIKFETEIRADKFVLMVHGSTEQQAQAREVLGKMQIRQPAP